ncbi:MAG: twin-arginine translocase TatA/TatE family subunit [Acetobacteraceae bacterium]
MGEFSIWHWLIVLIVVLLLFGGGKVSGLMGEFANGIKAFKKGMADDDTPTVPPAIEPSLGAEPTVERIEREHAHQH